jgi:hypothetical protein
MGVGRESPNNGVLSMKKMLGRGKLVLNRETVRALRSDQFKKVVGGVETNPNCPESGTDSCVKLNFGTGGPTH